MMPDALVVTGWAKIYGEWLLKPIPSLCVMTIWLDCLLRNLIVAPHIPGEINTLELAQAHSTSNLPNPPRTVLQGRAPAPHIQCPCP